MTTDDRKDALAIIGGIVVFLFLAPWIVIGLGLYADWVESILVTQLPSTE